MVILDRSSACVRSYTQSTLRIFSTQKNWSLDILDWEYTEQQTHRSQNDNDIQMYSVLFFFVDDSINHFLSVVRVEWIPLYLCVCFIGLVNWTENLLFVRFRQCLLIDFTAYSNCKKITSSFGFFVCVFIPDTRHSMWMINRSIYDLRFTFPGNKCRKKKKKKLCEFECEKKMRRHFQFTT